VEQAVGAAIGALSIVEVMPEAYKHTLGGPRLKVDLETGMLAEGLLTFGMTLAVLWVVLSGPKNGIIKTFMIIGATLVFVTLGTPYTGPAMNPSNVRLFSNSLCVVHNSLRRDLKPGNERFCAYYVAHVR
jgi:aquaporin SIP